MRGKWNRDESWRKFGMHTVSDVCMVVDTMEIGESVGRQSDGVSVVLCTVTLFGVRFSTG